MFQRNTVRKEGGAHLDSPWSAAALHCPGDGKVPCKACGDFIEHMEGLVLKHSSHKTYEWALWTNNAHIPLGSRPPGLFSLRGKWSNTMKKLGLCCGHAFLVFTCFPMDDFLKRVGVSQATNGIRSLRELQNCMGEQIVHVVVAAAAHIDASMCGECRAQ